MHAIEYLNPFTGGMHDKEDANHSNLFDDLFDGLVDPQRQQTTNPLHDNVVVMGTAERIGLNIYKALIYTYKIYIYIK